MSGLDAQMTQDVFFGGEDKFDYAAPQVFGSHQERNDSFFGKEASADSVKERPVAVPQDAFLQALAKVQEQPFSPPTHEWSRNLRAYYKACRDGFAMAQGSADLAIKLPACNDISAWSRPMALGDRTSINKNTIPEWVTVLDYTVPEGYWLRVRSYAVEDDGNSTENMIWRILINERPVDIGNKTGHFTNRETKSIHGISIFERCSLCAPRQTFFTAKRDDRITVQAQMSITSPRNHDVRAALNGYLWRITNDSETTEASLKAK